MSKFQKENLIFQIFGKAGSISYPLLGFFFSFCFEINASNGDENPEEMKFGGSIICDALLI